MLNMRVSQCSSHQRCYLNNPTSTPICVMFTTMLVMPPPTFLSHPPHMCGMLIMMVTTRSVLVLPSKTRSSTQECFQNKVFPSVQSNKIVFGVTLVAACEPNKHPWELPINASAPKNQPELKCVGGLLRRSAESIAPASILCPSVSESWRSTAECQIAIRIALTHCTSLPFPAQFACALFVLDIAGDGAKSVPDGQKSRQSCCKEDVQKARRPCLRRC